MAQNVDMYRYYQCPVCWKPFTKSNTLKIHMRVHTGEKPYECVYCPKSFTTSGNLGDHLRVHSTARMFKCKLCGTKFKRKATLKRHNEMHAVYKKDKKTKESASILLSENADELLQTEIIDHPASSSGFEQNPRLHNNADIILTGNNEEILQTEIVHYPSQGHLGDFQENRVTSIEVVFPTDNEEESQERSVVIPPVVKEENFDDFYDATILELTEEVENTDGVQLRVHNIPGISSGSISSGNDADMKEQHSLHLQPSLDINARSSDRFKRSSVFSKPVESSSMPPELSKRYGSYITKMLKMIHQRDEQAKLIKELNKVIHDFIIENR